MDLVYSRLLLMHLKDPEFVLRHLKKCLKNSGVIACEEPQASSLETVPYSEGIERLNQLFIQLGKLQGFNFDIGEKLLSLLTSAGYVHLHGSFVQPIISMDEAISFVLMNAAELAPVAEKTGILGGDEGRRLLRALQHSVHEESAYYVFPRQAQIFGYKL